MTLAAEFAFELIPFYFLQTDSVINKGILISERTVAIRLIEINAIRHLQISTFHINCLCTDLFCELKRWGHQIKIHIKIIHIYPFLTENFLLGASINHLQKPQHLLSNSLPPFNSFLGTLQALKFNIWPHVLIIQPKFQQFGLYCFYSHIKHLNPITSSHKLI